MSFFDTGAGRKAMKGGQTTIPWAFKTRDLDAPTHSAICSSNTSTSNWNSSRSSSGYNSNGRGESSNVSVKSTTSGLMLPNKRIKKDKQEEPSIPSTRDVFSSSNNNKTLMMPPKRETKIVASSYDDYEDDDDFQGVPTNSTKTQSSKLDTHQAVHTSQVLNRVKQQPENLTMVNRGRKKASFGVKNTVLGVRGLGGLEIPLDKEMDQDDNDFRETTAQLLIPIKKGDKKRKLDEAKETEAIMKKFAQVQKQDEFEKDKKKCPYCSQVLWPLPHLVETALKEIEKKDKDHEKKQNQLIEKENSKSTSSYSRPFSLVSKRQVTTEEKDAFCHLHHVEMLIKPQGQREGYPVHIDFGKIQDRILKLDDELKQVISNQLKSEYRQIAEDAYKEQGAMKARSALSVLARFEASLPGYYGPKGSAVILQALSTIYLNTAYLSKHLVSPQLPLEFLQQVLVPEVGFRLIRQDLLRKIKSGHPPAGLTEKAKLIMVSSREYGSAMFPAEDADIEGSDDDGVSTLFFHLDDDSEEEEEEMDSYD